jgi:hypothetical protein
VTYFLGILPQIEDRCHQYPRRQNFIENAVRKVLHHLPSDSFEIARSNLGKDRDARKVRVHSQHKFHAKALAVIFETIENLL